MELLGRLRAHYAPLGIDAYLLGGFIRDMLLHRVSYDIDLAVSGDAEEQAHGIALATGGTFVPLDHERGIYRVAAIIPDDGRWTVDIATLQGNIDDDLRRRDFTVDALAVPLADTGVPYGDWPIIDPTGGLNDLA